MIVIVICLMFYWQDCARDKRQYLGQSELHFGISALQWQHVSPMSVKVWLLGGAEVGRGTHKTVSFTKIWNILARSGRVRHAILTKLEGASTSLET